MRRKFAIELLELMSLDNRIVLITADLGYMLFDEIKAEYSDRYYNVGAAEQVMMDMAVGFALCDKIPVTYSITPFLLYRPFETIRTYIDHENLKVKMVGSGRGNDYGHQGFSHDATDHEIIKNFKNIRFMSPDKDYSLGEVIFSNYPVYLNLKR